MVTKTLHITLAEYKFLQAELDELADAYAEVQSLLLKLEIVRDAFVEDGLLNMDNF
jgi:hypothetical protein